MASATANRGRSSTGGQVSASHLGAYSRMEIADFDSRGRYPTTPSPQDVRHAPSPSGQWYGDQGQTSVSMSAGNVNHTRNLTGDRPTELGYFFDSNAQANGLVASGSYSGPTPSAQDATPTQQRGSADSNLDTRQLAGPSATGPNAADGSTTDQFVIQDPAKGPLPFGPRHPQAPSRSSTASQQQGQGSPIMQPTAAAFQRTTQQASNSPTMRTGNQPQASSLSYGLATVQLQNSPAPQITAPPEEVCVECMMRDRDMADINVRGPGNWDRESDAGIRELLEREDEEERLWRDRHAAELAVPGNKLRPPRRASKGHRLTEQNLKIWLTLNPKEAHARLMTIDSYIRQQAELLAAEADARRKAQQEAQQVDARMKDTYAILRNSTYDIGSAGMVGDDFGTGVRIQPPRSSIYGGSSASPKEDYKHKRDMTLLENGMIMERVDVKREEKERRKEEKKARKLSQTTDISGITPNGYAPPMTPNSIGMEGSSYDFDPPYPASATSLHQLRPKSAPLNAPLNTYHSHASLDGRSSRFMGRQAPWNSGVSVAPSGSMMDMHLALDQEYSAHPMPGTISQHHQMSSFSLPASTRKQARPHTADALMHTRGLTSPDTKSGKKSSGFGKLWRLVRPKKSESKHQTSSFVSTPQDEDMSIPLPPPPKMPYLAGQRSPGSPHPRQASMPASLNGSPGPISPTTAPSSLLPSPTSNRFPWRESTGDDRRQSTVKDFTNDINGFVHPESAVSPQFIDQNGNAGPPGNNSAEYARNLQAPHTVPLPRSPAPSTMVSSSAHSPRPMSSVHKPLPPPPSSNEAPARPVSSYPSFPGPGNYATPRPMTQVMNPDEGFQPPVALHDYDYRRQSVNVNGLPPGAAQIQQQRSVPAMHQMDNGFQEFGYYNETYGDQLYMNGNQSDGGKTKRRSRFLPFLSKKDKPQPQLHLHPQQLNGDALRYSTYSPSPSGQMTPVPSRPPFGHTQRSRSSASLSTPEYVNGMVPQSQPFGFGDNGRPMSGVSAFSNGQRPNKTLIDEVVPRDNEFLAYRYPSTEQTLNISRR